ncbi:RNA polymerase sigma factor SigY [Cohnella abietis]|uniref:RNA polymerase sigma factor SigY n=1 Tax=Cohnella abietis TaxID=2507935 RepID=A0A3T1DAZ3_9BACL|nr:RNA polymerase sigma factor SigY [Cohnella abietis]BBI35260.1 RNA polymerase sigma factor SigY [Cohnella abietis]
MKPMNKLSRNARITDTELAALLREHYSMVFHYLLKVTMDRSLAEDMTQETMIRAIEKADRYDGSSKFSSWLITIGTRLFLDTLRKRKREQKQLQDESRMSALQWETISRGTEWSELMESLEKLSKEERMPLVLKHYYGYTYEEIGEIMSLPPGTVKSRIFYGIRKIREEWKENEAIR